MDGGQLIKTDRSPRATVASVASGTVAEIYDRILTDIVGGHRPIGAPIRDREVAAELGVSRTPVREAMLLLRQAGVIEVVASRYTRVATLDADAAAQLAQVWVGLFGLVIEELLGSDAEIDVALLGELHERAADDVDDPRRFVDATDRFYDHLVSCSRNLHLVRAIGAVAHALGVALANLLDSERLPEFLHMQAQFLEAVRTRDAGLGRASMTALRASADGR